MEFFMKNTVKLAILSFMGISGLVLASHPGLKSISKADKENVVPVNPNTASHISTILEEPEAAKKVAAQTQSAFAASRPATSQNSPKKQQDLKQKKEALRPLTTQSKNGAQKPKIKSPYLAYPYHAKPYSAKPKPKTKSATLNDYISDIDSYITKFHAFKLPISCTKTIKTQLDEIDKVLRKYYNIVVLPSQTKSNSVSTKVAIQDIVKLIKDAIKEKKLTIQDHKIIAEHLQVIRNDLDYWLTK